MVIKKQTQEERIKHAYGIVLDALANYKSVIASILAGEAPTTYKVEVFIDDFTAHSRKLLGRDRRIISEVYYVTSEIEAQMILKQAKDVAEALFKDNNGEVEVRFDTDEVDRVEAEYFNDFVSGEVGELFALYQKY